MRAILFKEKNHGYLNGVLLSTPLIRTEIIRQLKLGTAAILIDNEEVLMYQLSGELPFPSDGNGQKNNSQKPI